MNLANFVPTKPKEMVTGPAAFENYKRLMTALLAIPKSDTKPAQGRKRPKPKGKD